MPSSDVDKTTDRRGAGRCGDDGRRLRRGRRLSTRGAAPRSSASSESSNTPVVLVVKRPGERRLRVPWLGRPRRGRAGRSRSSLMRRGGRPQAAEPEPRELFVRSASRHGRPVVTMRARDLGDACVVEVEVDGRDEDAEPLLVQLRRRAAGEHIRDRGRRGSRLSGLRDPRLRRTREESVEVQRHESEFPGARARARRRRHRPSPARAASSQSRRRRARRRLELHGRHPAARLEALELVRAAVELADRIEHDAQETAKDRLTRTEEEVRLRRLALDERENEVDHLRRDLEAARQELARAEKELAERRQEASDGVREAEAHLAGARGGSLRDDRRRNRARRGAAGRGPGRGRRDRRRRAERGRPDRCSLPDRGRGSRGERAVRGERLPVAARGRRSAAARRPRRSCGAAPLRGRGCAGRCTLRGRGCAGHCALGRGGRAFSGERGGRADRRGRKGRRR